MERVDYNALTLSDGNPEMNREKRIVCARCRDIILRQYGQEPGDQANQEQGEQLEFDLGEGGDGERQRSCSSTAPKQYSFVWI